MIYKVIHIPYDCRNYKTIIDKIDEAINQLTDALVTNVFENNVTGYKMNTGQSDVSVTINSEKDAISNIEKLEKLRDFYQNRAMNRRIGRQIRLRDGNNFRY